MSVYQPVCTCDVDGIIGCRVHLDPEPMTHEPVVVVAEKIAAGGGFADEDAVRVARAFLEAQT